MPSGSIRCLNGIERARHDHDYLGCSYLVNLLGARRCIALKRRRLELGFAITLLVAVRA